MSYRTHYFSALDPEGPTACGGNSYGFGASTSRADCNCRRCLASLAKADREFRAKARARFATSLGADRWLDMRRWPGDTTGFVGWCSEYDATRAIAAEEGRP